VTARAKLAGVTPGPGAPGPQQYVSTGMKEQSNGASRVLNSSHCQLSVLSHHPRFDV